MIFKKTFKFRLQPAKNKEPLFYQFAGARRWIYNRGLDQRKKAWEEEKRKVTLYDQNNELVLLKEKEDLAWLKDIHSQVLQQALHDLDQAFLNFFTGSGYPRFKCKGVRDSFRYPQGVKVDNNKAWLPKIGWINFRKSREIEGAIKQTTITLEDGKWYISFSCEIEKEPLKPQLNLHNVVGIDLGLTNFATLAIGNKNKLITIENPKFLRKHLKRIRFLSCQLSAKQKYGNNRNKARAKLNKLHRHLKNLRLDFSYKLALMIVKSHDIIGVETMNIKGMVQGLKTLARAISDAGWGVFLTCLKNKATEYGKTLYEIASILGNTRKCSNCGRNNAITLGKREYSCGCGQRIDRDFNAAINIKNQAVGASV
jgi:putative transposase